MTTTEHLQKIKAKCEQLMAIAEKRTPGKWQPATETIWTDSECIAGDMTYDDTQFIASCAGHAEAGWRATSAACKSLLARICSDCQCGAYDSALAEAKSIIAAWPEELL